MVHVRKLVKAGEASHTVSLPKEWIERNKLKKGDIIYLEERSDNELVVTPHEKTKEAEKKEITLEVDSKDIETIQREITSAYINNYNTIYLIGESVPEKTNEIRNMLHHFVALEVAEQTGRKITAKDMLNLQEISVEKTVRRMDATVRSMLDDYQEILEGKDLKESIVSRDGDVNRMYFLLLRLLKQSLKDINISKMIGIAREGVLSHWNVTVSLENFADCCKNLCSLKVAKKQDVKKTVAELSESFNNAMKAYYTKDKKTAEDVARKRQELEKKTEKLEPGIAENIKSMITLVNNIAKQVIDEDL